MSIKLLKSNQINLRMILIFKKSFILRLYIVLQLMNFYKVTTLDLSDEYKNHKYFPQNRSLLEKKYPNHRMNYDDDVVKWSTPVVEEVPVVDTMQYRPKRQRTKRPLPAPLSPGHPSRSYNRPFYQTMRQSPAALITSSSHFNQISSADPVAETTNGYFIDNSELVREARPSHQVVHIHHSAEKKSHGKYLWPIVGGGLTMLMGFLIISNILLSIPLLAIGASSLFNQGGYHSQQLVPVYNLSQLSGVLPSGRRRRRKRSIRQLVDVNSSSPLDLGKPTRTTTTTTSVTSRLGYKEGLIMRDKTAADLEARIGRLIDGIVVGSSAASRILSLGNLFGGTFSRRRQQVLRAAYCYRPRRSYQ